MGEQGVAIVAINTGRTVTSIYDVYFTFTPPPKTTGAFAIQSPPIVLPYSDRQRLPYRLEPGHEFSTIFPKDEMVKLMLKESAGSVEGLGLIAVVRSGHGLHMGIHGQSLREDLFGGLFKR
jgi:hypothetical protein